MLTFNLQRFADEGEGQNQQPAVIRVGDKEYTAEQIAELEKSYKKLEAEFTKTKQSQKELEQQLEALKPWGEFDAFVRQHPTLAKELAEVVERYQSGQQVTQANLNTLAKAIDKAEQKGDDELVKRLEALEEQLMERQIFDTFDELERRAKSEGLEDFSLDGFKEFAGQWLEEELGLGDDDEITPKELRQAYTAYKAHLLEETLKRGKIPNLRSDSTGAPPQKEAPQKRSWKERQQELKRGALEFIQRSFGG